MIYLGKRAMSEKSAALSNTGLHIEVRKFLPAALYTLMIKIRPGRKE